MPNGTPQYYRYLPYLTTTPFTAGLTGAMTGYESAQQRAAKERALDIQQQQTHSQIQLNQARIENLKQQGVLPGKPMSPYGKAIFDAQMIKSSYGPNDQRTKDAYNYAGNLLKQTPEKMLTPGDKALQVQEGKNFGNLEQTAIEVSQKSAAGEQDVNDFLYHYNNLGRMRNLPPFLKRTLLPEISSSAQLARKAQNRLALNLLAVQKFGRVTNMEMKIVQNGTLNLGLYPQAANVLAPQLQALFRRNQEFPKFLSALRKEGVTNPATADSLWSYYIHRTPMIDAQGKIHLENLTKWRHYINKNAIKAATEGKDPFPVPPKEGAPEAIASVTPTAPMAPPQAAPVGIPPTAPSEAGPPPAPPQMTAGKQQWMQQAKQANPGVSDADLSTYYDKKYGG